MLLFHVLDYQDIGHRVQTEEEALENIQDAIVDYLSVVDELTQESETRVTWKLREMPKLSGVSHKRAIKAVEKASLS